MAQRSHAERAVSVEVRRARHEDIPAIVEIEEASFSDPWSPDSFAGYVSGSRHLMFVATDGGAVAGYVVLLLALPDADLANIAVAARSRRKGVGAALVSAALSAARGANVENVYLEVRESNRGAIALYERAGFAPFGRRRRYYRDPTEDAMVLRMSMAEG
jgi:ribosomal-protein-alanine N-acetyltransferase